MKRRKRFSWRGIRTVFLAALSFGPLVSLAATNCEAPLDQRILKKAELRLLQEGFRLGSEKGTLFLVDTLATSAQLLEETQDPDVACSWTASRLSFPFKKFCAREANVFRRLFAQKIYRPSLNTFRFIMTHAGDIFRKYLSGQDMDTHALRWASVETLFKTGTGTASFGHPVRPGMVEVLSPVIRPEKKIDGLAGQQRSIGIPLEIPGRGQIPVRPLTVGPMIGVSGMSFPQLSAQSHISLLYIHLKLAKDGIPMLLNTGEGGPRFHLALLRGDAEELKKVVNEWSVETGRYADGSWNQAKIETFIEDLMAARKELFAEFSAEDLGRAQIVAQFGSALNGVRSEGGAVDLRKLYSLGQEKAVGMIQYKLKQAAKRGAKVDAKKIDEITAAMRELPNENLKVLHSPKINADMSSWEDIASLILITKALSQKPVSIKLGVGDLEDYYEFLKFLRDANALPDHLQLDGRGLEFSPGSGNAPFLRNTSLPLNDAVIVTNAFLRKLGVRQRVFVDATGDVLVHSEAVEKLALGADGVSAARLWMGMGLGCAQVRQCASGTCPYGIASASKNIFSQSLDPRVIGPQGYRAAASWQSAFVSTLGESGVEDWRNYFSERGMGHPQSQVRKVDAKGLQRLDSYYSLERLRDLFGATLTEEEIRNFAYSARTIEVSTDRN